MHRVEMGSRVWGWERGPGKGVGLVTEAEEGCTGDSGSSRVAWACLGQCGLHLHIHVGKQDEGNIGGAGMGVPHSLLSCLGASWKLGSVSPAAAAQGVDTPLWPTGQGTDTRQGTDTQHARGDGDDRGCHGRGAG